MFFNDLTQLPEIATRASCAIFVIPPETELKLKNTFYLKPEDEKATISVAQIRDFIALASNKQTTDQFFVITPADRLNIAAQNAFLKNLEEPKDHVHYLLFTKQPSALLPTILSRAELYYLKKTNQLTTPPEADPEIIKIAKQLISTPPTTLPTLATDIAKHKDARTYAINIVSTAIELLFKSYFITKNPKLLEKIPHFTELYDNLQNNGHVKLHLIADLC